MKTTFILVLLQLCLASALFTQPCGPIYVSTQAEVNALPPCSVVTGDVEISSYPSGDIFDLSYFENLDTIFGQLTIQETSEDTLDLSGLVHVPQGLYIGSNGLKHLVTGTSDFENIFSGIEIVGNSLESLVILNVDTIKKATSIQVYDNNLKSISLPDLSDINRLGSVYIWEDSVHTLTVPTLSSLEGQFYMAFADLSSLPFLNGLSHIGNLILEDMPLTNLAFLGNLRSSNALEIFECSLLTDVSTLENLQHCNILKLIDNPMLSACCFLPGLQRLNHISWIEMSGNAPGCATFIDVLDTCLDTDNDGVTDGEDNCPTISNAAQTDLNNNGIGDVCEDLSGNDDTGIDVEASDIFIEQAARGVILKSPSGYCYRIRIDDLGNVTSIKVDCP